MRRFQIQFEERQIDLPAGELLVGRAPECHIRLMSPTVSRRHLRMVVVPNTLVAYDLDSSNGSWVNGIRLNGPLELSPGDVIRVGSQVFKVVAAPYQDASPMPDEDPLTVTDTEMVCEHIVAHPTLRPPAAPGDVAQEPLSPEAQKNTWVPAEPRGTGEPTQELTQAGLNDNHELSTGSQTCPSCRAGYALSSRNCPRCGAEAFSTPAYRTCPHCKQLVAEDAKACLKCGREPQAKKLAPTDTERRRAVRLEVYFHALYISPTATFDAVISNISTTGIFLVAELFDPVGTLIDVLLSTPDQGGARFSGEVVRLVTSDNGNPSVETGMGIQFVNVGPAARKWLDNCIAALADRRTLQS